jgi:hypothetical protein
MAARSLAPQPTLFPLGTAVSLPDGDGMIRVRPHALLTVEGGEPGSKERVLQANVDLGAVAGQVDALGATLAIADGQGNLYRAEAFESDGGLPEDGVLVEGTSVEGTVVFRVPTKARSLTLVLLGADGESAAVHWSIAGH